MNIKNAMVMVIAAGTAFGHVEVEAASGKAGLNACVSALAREISESQGAGVNVRLDEDIKAGRNRLLYPTTFLLDAVNPANEEIVAKVNCTVDTQGKVRKFVVLSDEAPVARLRKL